MSDDHSIDSEDVESGEDLEPGTDLEPDKVLEPDEVLDPEADDEDDHRLLPVVRVSQGLVPLDPLTAYLNEIRKYELLTEEEEHKLAVLYKETGDTAAVYRLITSNLNVVVKVAMRFKREWQNMMDLVQEGNVGLMHAVKNFDPFRGVRLPVYATWWIKAYILKFILDNWRLVKVGTTNTRRKLLYNLNKEKEKLEAQGFTASTKLLAERFGVDEQEVIDVQAGLGASDVSMDTPLTEDGTATPAHFLTDGSHPGQDVEKDQFHKILRDLIEDFSSELKPIEQEIVEERILSDDPVSLQEIGTRHDITREAVRQTEARLMKKLKTYLLETMPEAAEYFNA